MKKLVTLMVTILILAVVLTACANDVPEDGSQVRYGTMGEQKASVPEEEADGTGALLPYEALEYMMNAENLYIIDLSSRYEYEQDHFTGAVNVNPEEVMEWVDEIPEGQAVIVHDRMGAMAPAVYQTIQAEREDIAEISYIAGVPLIYYYNAWMEENI